MYVIMDKMGQYWQASKGFLSTNPATATVYKSEQDAQRVSLLCCKPRAEAQVVRRQGDARA